MAWVRVKVCPASSPTGNRGELEGTVYRAALAQDGLIRRVRIPDQADRYDKTITPHDHLICDRCGRLADIQLGDFSRTLEEQLGIPVESYDLSVHYICPDCRGSERQPA